MHVYVDFSLPVIIFSFTLKIDKSIVVILRGSEEIGTSFFFSNAGALTLEAIATRVETARPFRTLAYGSKSGPFAETLLSDELDPQCLASTFKPPNPLLRFAREVFLDNLEGVDLLHAGLPALSTLERERDFVHACRALDLV